MSSGSKAERMAGEPDVATDQTEAASRYQRLAAFLEQDPANARLIADTVEAAIDAGAFAAARALIAALPDQSRLPPEFAHLDGVAAMGAADWSAAVVRFDALIASGADAPPVRFNYAWSLTKLRQFDAALGALDAATVAALPQAAALAVQLRHQRGDMAAAEREARAAIARFPEHAALNAAVSTLAIDIEDRDLAARCAHVAGDHPEALATAATLALGDEQLDEAARLFDQALDRNPGLPRAWIGRGLTRLLGPDKMAAAADIDRGAELFDTHLGSWIAAGWAQLLAGDRAAARARFERALALDDRFAESHGSLAVIDVLEGRPDPARRGVKIALRLDRACFSAALAGLLLAAAKGDQARADQILRQALATPIGGSGKTIAQTMMRLGLTGR
jgi:tetratricopeptide (TPR) repeat protein